jgi:hypothetical protein
MSNGKQETIETVETQTLHAKIYGIGIKEGYTENVCGTYENIIEYCKNNKFEVQHYYDYSELDSIPGGGYFKHLGKDYLIEKNDK